MWIHRGMMWILLVGGCTQLTDFDRFGTGEPAEPDSGPDVSPPYEPPDAGPAYWEDAQVTPDSGPIEPVPTPTGAWTIRRETPDIRCGEFPGYQAQGSYKDSWTIEVAGGLASVRVQASTWPVRSYAGTWAHGLLELEGTAEGIVDGVWGSASTRLTLELIDGQLVGFEDSDGRGCEMERKVTGVRID